MLQQTQVNRVIPKYYAFLQKFPNVQALADARLGNVLRLWQGLGYNRRAKYLWQSAQVTSKEHNGIFPDNQQDLTQLPGVGINTAGAICAYAYNQPVIFIETNIRTVYIHHFFNNREDVTDKELKLIIEETLDQEHPREWYWALMDYGAFLKSTVGNKSTQSKHYAKQSRFEGSKRQVRGLVLKSLADNARMSKNNLYAIINDQRLNDVLKELCSEGMITLKKGLYSLA